MQWIFGARAIEEVSKLLVRRFSSFSRLSDEVRFAGIL